MLHQLLPLKRPLYVVDVETTGTHDARIVELAFQRWTSTGVDKEYRTLVNPGIPIPERVSKIHGIRDHDIKDAPTWAKLGPNVAKGFSNCDYAGKNVRFDLQMIADEMRRIKQPWGYADAKIICCDRLEHLGEPRDLTSLYKRRCGKDLDDAHQALADVRATGELLVAQLQLFDKLPRDLSMLHELMWGDWIDSEGKVRWRDDEPVLTFGKHRGESLRTVPRDYLTWVANAPFPEDVQKIALEASLGVFPQRG